MLNNKKKNTDIFEKEENIPLGQLILDMPFLLLTVGMIVMLLFYTVWGLYEVMSLPEY